MRTYHYIRLSQARAPGEPCVVCWQANGNTVPSTILVQGSLTDPKALRGYCEQHWLDFQSACASLGIQLEETLSLL